jgi:hypothetical protein
MYGFMCMERATNFLVKELQRIFIAHGVMDNNISYDQM